MKYNDNGEYKDIYVKAFDTLPVGAEVDYDGSVVPSGWTEITDPNTYSTDEVRIGTWIDNKPLYRKTFTYTNISQITSGSFATINTGLANANIVKFEGVNYRNDLGISRMLPYNDVNDKINILSVSQGQGIRIYYTGTFATSADNIVITIYYTKN